MAGARWLQHHFMRCMPWRAYDCLDRGIAGMPVPPIISPVARELSPSQPLLWRLAMSVQNKKQVTLQTTQKDQTETDRQTETGRQRHRQTDRTERHTDRLEQTDGQTDRCSQPDRQTPTTCCHPYDAGNAEPGLVDVPECCNPGPGSLISRSVLSPGRTR